MENIIEIGSFADNFQATLAKEILENNGIHCIITGVNYALFDTVPDTKVKLLINNEDMENAKALLESFFENP